MSLYRSHRFLPAHLPSDLSLEAVLERFVASGEWAHALSAVQAICHRDGFDAKSMDRRSRLIGAWRRSEGDGDLEKATRRLDAHALLSRAARAHQYVDVYDPNLFAYVREAFRRDPDDLDMRLRLSIASFEVLDPEWARHRALYREALTETRTEILLDRLSDSRIISSSFDPSTSIFR